MEYEHHGDRLVPRQQRFGQYTRSLMKALDVPVHNIWGLRPAVVEGTKEIAPLTGFRDLDAARLLDDVTTFNFHPHLPHYELTAPEGEGCGCSGASASTRTGRIRSPTAGNTEFNALIWMPPAGSAPATSCWSTPPTSPRCSAAPTVSKPLAQPLNNEIGVSMQTAVRPWVTSGIALVGASVIAVAPISVAPAPTTLVPDVYVPSVQMPAVDLQASIIDILTIPAFRQYVLNQINDYATWGIGFAEAGANLAQAIGMLPETLLVLTQQLLSLDLQGALTTIETALVGTVVAVGAPILDSIITVRERSLAVQLALQSAVPDAFIGASAAVFGRIDGVLRASIAGGQEVVDAVLTLNLGNIVDALVSATQGFLGSSSTAAKTSSTESSSPSRQSLRLWRRRHPRWQLPTPRGCR